MMGMESDRNECGGNGDVMGIGRMMGTTYKYLHLKHWERERGLNDGIK